MAANKDITIGIWVYAEPSRLQRTLESLHKHTLAPYNLVLLPDGPDRATMAALSPRHDVPQLGTERALGAPACFNRLITYDQAEVVVFLESGVIVTPGWLEYLVEALHADPGHGLAGPSTNMAWNEQRLPDAPDATAAPGAIEAYAIQAAHSYRGRYRSLEPLYSLNDFCYAVKREVIEAIGSSDEQYTLGPCWEMDYNIRAARAGFKGLWACAAYVHRRPLAARRREQESRLTEENKRLYQRKFCRLQLDNPGRAYAPHCEGDTCVHFAPQEVIQLHLPLAAGRQPGPPAPSQPTVQVIQPASRPAHPTGPEGPLVSCIMPTHNRRSFVPQAIRYFLRQNYAHRELIIIDDGTDPVQDLVPADPRIRYLRQEAQRTVGAKRNLACQAAHGEIILHWDDDDWMAEWRISYQVAHLLREQTDICGLDRLLHYHLGVDQAWEYIYLDRSKPWLAGGTLCYRKALWQGQPFLDLNVGEDTRFVWSHQPKRLTTLQDNTFYIALIHHGNTSPKRTTDNRWQPYSTEHIRTLLGTDLAFYTGCPPDQAQNQSSRERTAQRHDDSTKGDPLVSCIMPTYNRRLFVPQAIQYFLRQDYPHKELVIVDDGSDAVADLIPAHAQIRYIRLNQRVSLGAKRNIALTHSQGDIIAHWDDDDWYHASYLRQVIQRLLQSGDQQAIVGIASYLVYILADATLKVGHTSGIAGATLCYFKALWERQAYRDVATAEDYFFLQDAQPHVLRLDALELFVVIRHTHHTWKQEGGVEVDRYLRCLQNHVKRLENIVTRDDAHFYALARHQLYTWKSREIASVAVTPEMPLVSCIMPTYNRRLFVPQAIQYFLRQDYLHRELVIVDDGSDAVADLIPAHAQIRYIRLDQKVSIGMKRNMAVEQSKGTIIVHWDDDDWYAANRISYQIKPLLAKQAEICGLETGFIYDMIEDTFWSCEAYLHTMMFYADIHGGSILYTRELWEKYAKYPDTSLAEDAQFLRAASSKQARIVKLPNQNVFIYLRHHSNAWEFICGTFINPSAWKRIPSPAFLTKEDLQFYHDVLVKLLLDTNTHKAKGDMFRHAGRYGEALQCYDRAVELDPTNVWAWYDKGQTLEKVGQYDPALQAVREADRLLHPQDGNRTWIHSEFGTLFLLLRDKPQARHQFETALRYNATNQIARDGLKRL